MMGRASVGVILLFGGGPPAAMRTLHVLPHPFPTALSPEPALAIPPKPRRRIEQIRRIHPHHPALELRRNVQREVDVLRPYTRRQSIRSVIRQLHRFRWRTEGHRHEYRAEDLHLRDRRRRLNIREQRRRIEATVLRTRPRRLPHR